MAGDDRYYIVGSSLLAISQKFTESFDTDITSSQLAWFIAKIRDRHYDMSEVKIIVMPTS